MPVRLVTIAVVALLVASPVNAQESRVERDRRTLTSFNSLPERLHVGQTVYITDSLARETEGRLLRLSAESATLLVQGSEREFPRNDIHRVARRGDPLANGVGMGAGIFGAWAFVSILAGGCEGGGGGSCAAAGGVMVAIGAGVGALIDSAIQGKTVVYRATPLAVTARPLFTSNGAGAAVTLRF